MKENKLRPHVLLGTIAGLGAVALGPMLRPGPPLFVVPKPDPLASSQSDLEQMASADAKRARRALRLGTR